MDEIRLCFDSIQTATRVEEGSVRFFLDQTKPPGGTSYDIVHVITPGSVFELSFVTGLKQAM